MNSSTLKPETFSEPALKYLKKPIFINLSGVNRLIMDTETLLYDTVEQRIIFPYENIKVEEKDLREGEEINIAGDYKVEGNFCKLNLTVITDFNVDHILLFGARLPDADRALTYSPALRLKYSLVLDIPVSLLKQNISLSFNSKDGRSFNKQVIAKNGLIEMITNERDLKNEL